MGAGTNAAGGWGPAPTPRAPLRAHHSVQPLLLPVPSFLLSSERLAKYNQLLRIEAELGADAVYAGENWRHIGW